VPLQGHWERQNTPLRRLGKRESRLAAVVAAAIALSVAIGTYFVLSQSDPALAPGCVKLVSGSTMGGVQETLCGNAAASRCSAYLARNDDAVRPLHDACRKAGYN
jgi:hypothetical protein